MPASSRSRVVLPAPFSPSTTTLLPARAVLAPRAARRAEVDPLVARRAQRAGVGPDPPRPAGDRGGMVAQRGGGVGARGVGGLVEQRLPRAPEQDRGHLPPPALAA